MTDAKLVEGFDNEQLLKLKNKQSMHQAGNEENQWKFVYCVLFPDTRPFEVPFPCKSIRPSDVLALIALETTGMMPKLQHHRPNDSS